MAITLTYNPSAALLGGTSQAAGFGIAADQQDRYLRNYDLELRRFLEQQRQYDTTLAYNAQVAGLQDRMSRAQLAQGAYQYDTTLAQQQQEQAAAYDMNMRQMAADQQRQEMAASQAADAQQFRELRLQADMQTAERARQAEQAMAMRKQIFDEFDKGRLSQNQRDDMLRQWSEWSGMPAFAPTHDLEAAAQAEQQKRMETIQNDLGVPASVAEVYSQLQPSEQAAFYSDMEKIRSAQRIAEDKASEAQVKEQEKAALKAEVEAQKKVAASHDGWGEYMKAQADYRAQQLDDARQQQMWEQQKQAHDEAERMAASRPQQKGQAKYVAQPFTKPQPAPKAVPPTLMSYADKMPVVQSAEDYDRLPPYTRYIGPDGQPRQKMPQ